MSSSQSYPGIDCIIRFDFFAGSDRHIKRQRGKYHLAGNHYRGRRVKNDILQVLLSLGYWKKPTMMGFFVD